MRILFDLLHPAHFHLFKNVMVQLRKEGHEIEIIARQKDCLPDLLEGSGFEFEMIPRKKGGLFTFGLETVKATAMAVSLARRKGVDIMAGTSISIGPAARLTGAKAIIFEEDDASVVPVFAKLGYPFAHYVVTPECLAYEKHGRKHVTYAGYHELAYLHPDYFEPDEGVREELGLSPGERYFVVRLVSLTAHHDVGQKGLAYEQARKVIDKLRAHGRVFISAEREVEEDLQEYVLGTKAERIFDVMAFADIVVGDSQTMAAEAAVLGTPSLRCNTFVGRLSYLEELENKYGLTKGFLPEDFEKLLAELEGWLGREDLKEQWKQKRDVMIGECVDVTDWILEFLNSKSGT